MRIGKNIRQIPVLKKHDILRENLSWANMKVKHHKTINSKVYCIDTQGQNRCKDWESILETGFELSPNGQVILETENRQMY